jgi:hypothetical protein
LKALIFLVLFASRQKEQLFAASKRKWEQKLCIKSEASDRSLEKKERYAASKRKWNKKCISAEAAKSK